MVVALSLTPFLPETINWNVKVSAALVISLAGSVTSSETLPFEQGSEAGNPAILGVDLNWHTLA